MLKSASTLLVKLSVGKKRLCKCIQENPQELSKWVIGTRVAPLPDSEDEIESRRLKMKFLLDLGYGENPVMMKKALKIFRGRGEDFLERFDSIVNAGFDKKDVSEMIKLSPHILNLSRDTIQAKIDILVNELGYPLRSLITFPGYLGYTTQRVRLRLAMYKWLQDQGKARPNLSLSTILSGTEKKFFSRY
ncbi:Mitochodrial transcription termination factor-related protein, partial [Corchorus capsularis]